MRRTILLLTMVAAVLLAGYWAAMSVLASLWPALRASQLRPVEAIRAE